MELIDYFKTIRPCKMSDVRKKVFKKEYHNLLSTIGYLEVP